MLQIKNVNKTYADNTFSIKDISLSIPPGYICGIVGENGAGKTTLLKVIIGLYGRNKTNGGTIYINGYSLDDEEDKLKESIAVILDKFIFDDNMTLEQIGSYYGELYREYKHETYLEYLERFDLDKKSKFKNLSKGMSIKVQLAFALSHDAKLFIFDEPTDGLDRKFREEFLNICTDIVADGERSVVISSHITEDLDRIADYIAYIQDGELLFCLTKEELMDKFRLVKGESYKCKNIAKDIVVYIEEHEYSSSALIVNRKYNEIDKALEVTVPNIREIMYYMVKGGHKHAKDIAARNL